MPGYGTKYLTFDGDKTVHLLAEGGRTECGVPIPFEGASWTYEGRDLDVSSVCSACEKQAQRVEEVLAVEVEEPAPEPDDEPVRTTKLAPATKGKARSANKA